MIQLDHIVIAAQALEDGVVYVEDTLEVKLTHGGRHLKQGTHNKVLRLNDCYLEVIAPDPASTITPPWFGLGNKEVLESLCTPRLITWVAQSDDIKSLIQKTNYPVHVQAAERDHLRWQFSFPNDGNLIGDGLLPYLIHWESPSTVEHLPNTGCSLVRLEGFHHQAAHLNVILENLSLQDILLVKPGVTKLKATIQTPNGQKVLE